MAKLAVKDQAVAKLDAARQKALGQLGQGDKGIWQRGVEDTYDAALKLAQKSLLKGDYATKVDLLVKQLEKDRARQYPKKPCQDPFASVQADHKSNANPHGSA